MWTDNVKVSADSLSSVIKMVKISCSNAVEDSLEEIAEVAKEETISNINSRDVINSGLLKSSIRINKISNSEYRVGPDTNVTYAIFPELGTGIYNAKGRKGGWLYQTEEGDWYFTYGQKPKYFMRDAAKTAADESVYLIFLNLKRELRKNVN